jgi:hypothetical protein
MIKNSSQELEFWESLNPKNYDNGNSTPFEIMDKLEKLINNF